MYHFTAKLNDSPSLSIRLRKTWYSDWLLQIRDMIIKLKYIKRTVHPKVQSTYSSSSL